jgi:zinc protease
MHFKLGFLCLFCAFALPAFAKEPTTFTLENGMEVVVLEDHRAPVVVQMVWYRIGAADEVRGHSGVAHFLEHLLFKGTEKFPSGELSAAVARSGGTDNAFTSWDYTAYFQRVAADKLDLMMQMESDRMRNVNFSEQDVLTERDVILEERSQRTDNDPSALFNEQISAALYQNSPYGIPIIGWRHEMQQLTRQQALDWYQTYYAPNNAILIVAGDVDPAEVAEMAKKYYAPIAPTAGLSAERSRPQEPPHIAERRVILKDVRVSQPVVSRTYLATERDSGNQTEAAALTMLAQVLGGSSATSVLGRKLQFDTQVAVYAGASYSGLSYDDGSFDLTIVPSEGVSMADAEAALDKAISEFLTEGIDDTQFDRIKMQLRASLIYAEDDVSSQARRYGASLTSGLTLQDIKDWPDILQAVTREQVMAAAKSLFDKDKSVTGWMMSDAEVAQ